MTYRPLDDLIKEIEVDGERFIPANILMHEAIKRGLYESRFAPGHNSYEYRIVKKPFGRILKITNHDDWVLLLSLSDRSRNKKNKQWAEDLLDEWGFDPNDEKL